MNSDQGNLFRLVEKYNVPGPRYTSYPTALQFQEDFDRVDIENRIAESRSTGNALSLYFHIPFCFSLCWYCGCTKIITRDQDRGDLYLDYLAKEAELVQQTLHPNSEVKQIHFGGGTPTFLTPAQLRRLGGIIQSSFSIHEDVEFSVEIDPRRCSEDHIIALKEIGVNRASLGVQDTNADVQEAIHRIQPFKQTQAVTEQLRTHGISNINFDLIYGLPRQTPDTFYQTIEDVVSLDPDRFAIYSYAHIPSIMPAQKLLNEEEFPSTEQKLQMLMMAIDKLPGHGYRYIGMDHFAKNEDELSLALESGTLHRNFQGYSTHAELEMIALGMSGISMGKDLYYQNTKKLGDYYRALDEGRLPVKKVLPLNNEDQLRRKVIMDIMCRGEIRYRDFFVETGIDFEAAFCSEIENLKPLESDGLLIIDQTGIRVTSLGRLFLRNVAMVFDGYIRKKMSRPSYSKTI